MKKLNQSGFSAIEALLVLVILAILGGTGFYVYHAQNNANETLDTADKTAASQTQTIKKADGSVTDKTATASSPDYANFVEVIQNDSVHDKVIGIAKMTAQDVTSDVDQQSMLEAIHKSCDPKVPDVLIQADVFNDSDNYKREGNFVLLTSSCSPVDTNASNFGDLSLAYLIKKQPGWTLAFQTQEDPSCSIVDGVGWPTSILSSCIDAATDQPRAPKP